MAAFYSSFAARAIEGLKKREDLFIDDIFA